MIKESNWRELDKQQDCVEVEHVDDKISVAHKLRLILIRTKISDTDIQVPATASTNHN